MRAFLWAAICGIVLVLLMLWVPRARAAEEGVFLISAVAWHPGHEGEYESITPGISYRRGWVEAGAYRNSLGRGSVYAAFVIDTPFRDLKLLAGAVTGYLIQVAPAVVPVYRLTNRFELLVIPPVSYRGEKVDAAVSVRFVW